MTKFNDTVFARIEKETFEWPKNDYAASLDAINSAEINLSLNDLIQKAKSDKFTGKTEIFKH